MRARAEALEAEEARRRKAIEEEEKRRAEALKHEEVRWEQRAQALAEAEATKLEAERARR